MGNNWLDRVYTYLPRALKHEWGLTRGVQIPIDNDGILLHNSSLPAVWGDGHEMEPADELCRNL